MNKTISDHLFPDIHNHFDPKHHRHLRPQTYYHLNEYYPAFLSHFHPNNNIYIFPILPVSESFQYSVNQNKNSKDIPVAYLQNLISKQKLHPNQSIY